MSVPARWPPGRTRACVDAENRWIVDLGGEDERGLRGGPIAESTAMEVGARDELAHPCSCRERLEVGDPRRRFGSPVIDAQGAQRIEAEGLDPQPGIGQTNALRPCRPDPAQCRVRVSAPLGDEADAAGGHALPARVAELERELVRMLVGRRGRVDAPLGQVDIRIYFFSGCGPAEET